MNQHYGLVRRAIFVEMTPFRVEPLFVGRVWGSKDLRPWYDHVAKEEPIGEVWLTGDDCRAATGPHSGKTLGEIFGELPQAMLGEDAPSGDSPLLIKVIFAREKLSVQVHPDDRLAQRYGQPRGKTECWYALSAEAGAQVAAGLKAGVTMDEVKVGIEQRDTGKESQDATGVRGRHGLRGCGYGACNLAGIGVAGDTAELRLDVQDVRLRARA